MSVPYLALLCGQPLQPDLITAVRARVKLPLRYCSEKMVVFATADVLNFKDDGGCVVGDLFTRCDVPRRPSGRQLDLASTDLSAERPFLLRAFWGAYLAFATITSSAETTVVRDPSGMAPAYYLSLGDAILMSSDIQQLCDAIDFAPQVDWMALARHLQAFSVRSEETCLTGVRELLPGCRLRLRGHERIVDQAWSPWDHVTSEPSMGIDAAVDAVFQAATRSIETWARTQPNIMISVSGGLDSSIIASVIARAGKSPTLMTMATDEAEGDERRYARLLARHLDVPLIETHYRSDDVDVLVSSSAHVPRPALVALAQAELAIKTRMAAQRPIDAFFTGHGGDNVFCHLRSTAPARDAFSQLGWGGGWRAVMDICTLTGCSLAEALTQIVTRPFKRPSVGLPAVSRFLERIPMAEIDHPWLRGSHHRLPGKAAHIAMVLRILATQVGFPSVLPRQISPLLSQPLVETCLTIPTWLWCHRGVDRAPARRAFADALPAELIHRRSKGGPESFAFRIIEDNRAKLSDHLQGGFLASHGLVNREALAEVFRDPRPIAASDYVDLSLLAEAESWSRNRISERAV